MCTYRLDHMTWEEVDQLDRDRTIALLVLSPVQGHGPHLPLGTDIYGAKDVAELAMQKLHRLDPSLNYLLIPAIPLGCAHMAADFAGTLTLRGKTLIRVICDVCRSIRRHGFRHIVICNHCRDVAHLKAIGIALRRLARRHGIKACEPLGTTRYAGPSLRKTTLPAAWAHDLDPAKETHADITDTSFIGYKYPQLLRQNYRTLPPVLIDIEQCLSRGILKLRKLGAVQGYLGSPARATPDFGREYLECAANIVADAALRLCRGDQLPRMSFEMRFFLRFLVHLH